MRTMLLATAALLMFAGSASAVPPVVRGPVLRVPVCLTVMCGGHCLPKGVTCHKLPPNCPHGWWPCNQTCIRDGQACHR